MMRWSSEKLTVVHFTYLDELEAVSNLEEFARGNRLVEGDVDSGDRDRVTDGCLDG
jgi:hypothetical protein